jgi:hypothetical protein
MNVVLRGQLGWGMVVAVNTPPKPVATATRFGVLLAAAWSGTSASATGTSLAGTTGTAPPTSDSNVHGDAVLEFDATGNKSVFRRPSNPGGGGRP